MVIQRGLILIRIYIVLITFDGKPYPVIPRTPTQVVPPCFGVLTKSRNIDRYIPIYYVTPSSLLRKYYKNDSNDYLYVYVNNHHYFMEKISPSFFESLLEVFQFILLIFILRGFRLFLVLFLLVLVLLFLVLVVVLLVLVLVLLFLPYGQFWNASLQIWNARFS